MMMHMGMVGTAGRSATSRSGSSGGMASMAGVVGAMAVSSSIVEENEEEDGDCNSGNGNGNSADGNVDSLDSAMASMTQATKVWSGRRSGGRIENGSSINKSNKSNNNTEVAPFSIPAHESRFQKHSRKLVLASPASSTANDASPPPGLLALLSKTELHGQVALSARGRTFVQLQDRENEYLRACNRTHWTCRRIYGS